MTSAAHPARPDPGIQALALAAALESRGLVTAVYRTGGHQRHPCVWVASCQGRRVRRAEVVYAAPEADGRWWFWWSSLDRIAPATDITTAAERVARVLAYFRGIYAPAAVTGRRRP